MSAQSFERPNYWIGPYGVRVPMDIETVCAADGMNMRYKDGCETEIGVPSGASISKEDYLRKYAHLIGGIWWYRKNTDPE